MRILKKTSQSGWIMPKRMAKKKVAIDFFLSCLNYSSVFIICTFTSGCIAPRSMMDSGKVTPKNQLKIGGSYSANIPTQTIKNVVEAAETLDNDTIFDDAFNRSSRYLFAYSLDPLSVGTNYYVRYGLIKRFDVGYKFASGTHAFDVKYQFLGTYGIVGNTADTESKDKKTLYGSVGLQYSFNNYDLPGGFDKIQERLGFDLKRKDILIPIIFSKSLGEEEKTGHIAWGLAYNHTFLEYGFDPKDIYNIQTNLPFTPSHHKKNFGAIGAFANIKVGYKYVYFLTSFSAYYQNYGKFTMLDGSQVSFSGFTFVPSIGLQIVIPPLGKKGKKKVEGTAQ